MKNIIATLFLACLSLAAGAQSSKFDTGTHSSSALGQLEEISGMKMTTSKPKGNYTIITPAARAVSAASPVSSSGNSTLSLATGIITSFLFSALDALEDSRSLQSFDVGILGYNDSSKPDWTLKFEVLEVYPGTKYGDTVIAELYFDGIDVH